MTLLSKATLQKCYKFRLRAVNPKGRRIPKKHHITELVSDGSL